MIKNFLLIRARDEVPVGMMPYRQHLEEVHVPVALANPAIAREMKRWTMNDVLAGTGTGCELYPTIPGVDAVVEHMVGGNEGIQRVVTDQHYLDTVRPDERLMVDNLMDSDAQFIPVEQEYIVFSSINPPSLRMFDFVCKPDGMTRETFAEKLWEDADWAFGHSDYRQAVRKRVHSIVGGGDIPYADRNESFDGVIEMWIADAAKLSGLLDEQRRRRAAFCDTGRSFTMTTRESRIV